MYVDVWTQIARRQRKVDQIQKLSKMKLIQRSAKLMLIVTYYKVSNAILKQLLTAEVRFTALLRRITK